jgi:hypothetical protein
MASKARGGRPMILVKQPLNASCHLRRLERQS